MQRKNEERGTAKIRKERRDTEVELLTQMACQNWQSKIPAQYVFILRDKEVNR